MAALCASLPQYVKELHCAQDPEVTPYRSKYQARVLLEHAKAQLESRAASLPSPPSTSSSASLAVLLARMDYWLGLNFLETEEPSSGERLMTRAVSVLLPHALLLPIPVIDGHNALSILHTSRGHYAKARDGLLVAQRTYQSIKPRSSSLAAGEWGVVYNLHTLTLYYLAQVYGKLGKRSLSAAFCHLCLHRQVGWGGAFDRLEWVRNATTLALYYEDVGRWEEAWQCVRAAEKVLGDVHAGHTDDEQEAAAQRERIAEARADVHRALGSFYLAFLQADSGQPHRREANGRVDPVDPSDPSSPPAPCPTRRITFNTLALPPLPYPAPPSAIPYSAALPMFNAGFRHLSSALSHYPLDGAVSEHIGLCQSISALYAELSRRDEQNRLGVWLKRRAAVLLPCLDGLSAAHFLDLVRDLSDELATIHSRWMDDKLSKPDRASRAKANELGRKAVHHHTTWLSTFSHTNRHGETALRDRSEEDRANARPVLLAMFRIARLYGKMTAESVDAEVEWCRLSWEWYRKTVSKCEEVGGQAVFEVELPFCKEMVDLLPRKMEKLRREAHTGDG